MCCSGLFAQQQIALDVSEASLRKVLLQLEEQGELRFSFAEETIENRIISIEYQGPADQSLWRLLSEKCGLEFTEIAPGQVIIRPHSPRTSLCGFLKDRRTKEPLSFATLLLPGTMTGYTTDEKGYFEIAESDLSKGLEIQFIGYQQRLLQAAEFLTGCGEYFLEPKIESLGEVVVRSYLTNGINRNNDGSFRLQTAVQEVLPGMVEADVFQSAQWIPGVTSVNETVTDIQIRGGSPDQNLILYDGIRLYNTGHFFGMLSIFNPNITSKATLFKGGANAGYGDRISGVIDVEGVHSVPGKTTFGAGLNGTQADAFLKTPLGSNWGLVLSARRSYADIAGLRTPTFNALADKVFQNTVVGENETDEEADEEGLVEGEETFFFFDTYAKLLWQPSPKDSLYLSGLRTKNDLNFRLQLDENLERDVLSTENNGLSVHWSHAFSPHWRVVADFYYSDFSSSYQNQYSSDLVVEEFNRRQNTIKDQGASLRLRHLFGNGNRLRGGFQWQKSEVFYELFNSGLNESDVNERQARTNYSTAFFGTYEYRAQNGGFFSLGLRTNYFSLVGKWLAEPRLNAEWPLGSSFRAKLSGEKRYQSISQLVEFNDTRLRLQSGTWTLTDNDDFPLLESTQISSGLLFNAKGWTFDIDGYYKKIEGLTSFTNGFNSSSNNYSTGSSTIWGIDAFLKKRYRAYQLWVAYSFNDIDFLFPDIQSTAFDGNNDIRHSFRLSNALHLGRWKVTAGWRIRSGTPFTRALGFDPQEEDLVFDNINAARFPTYHRLDASAHYSFRWGNSQNIKSTLGIALQNVYDRRVPLSVFYRIDDDPETGQAEAEQLEQLSLGFTPNFLVRFEF